MEHLLLKAATTATDQGTFTAVISTASVDRDRDIIEPSAMVASLAKWAALGKLVPLAWNHTDEVIGHIDPASAEIVDDEVVAKGWVDQSIPRGDEAWRLVKSGTLSFSFGFLFDPNKDVTKLANGRYRVKNLDVFEISVVPVGPANNDTRVLNWKSAKDLRDESLRIEREVTESLLPEIPATTKRLASDLRSQLDAAGLERWGQGEGNWSYVDDWDPDAKWAVFEVSSDSDRRFLQVDYTTGDDGTITLGATETEVTRTTSYQPAGSGKAFTTSELQEVKAQLAAMQASLEDLRNKADETAQTGDGQPVDPLRKRSEELALEIASGGMSLRKPPAQVKAPPRDPSLEADLKQRSRDLMFEVLSYSTE
jgi:HK97 family phage prohead protease